MAWRLGLSPWRKTAWWRNHRHFVHLLIPAVLIAGAWTVRWLDGPQAAFALPMTLAAMYAGVPVVQEAWMRLQHKQFSIPLLITVASAGALWIGEVWEAAAVTFLYRFGGYLEGLTLSRTRAALRDLLDLRPVTAWVRRDGDQWQEIPADQVRTGEIVLVRPGDKVPVDGTVVAGRAALDTAALTGEPLPKEAGIGDDVLSGSVSRGGWIEVRADRVATDTTFNRLIRLVAQAQNDKPRVQRFLDRFAQWYTPAVMLAAVGIFAWSSDVKLALTFLVIGCPGALVVAAPVAVVAGLGRAARQGILIKGGERLELVGRLDTIAFDKTGTLTQGTPAVSGVDVFDADETDVLAWAMTAEERSEHHLAAAIHAYGKERGAQAIEADAWDFFPGLGVGATAGGRRILVGNRRLMEENGIVFEERHEQAAAAREEAGDALAWVAVDGRLMGLIGIHDPVREAAESLIPALRRAGVRKTVMLTGDNEAAARRVAQRLGIDVVKAGLLPEEKVEAVKALQAQGHVVAMIGDGINDAPALAIADVSIAMGTSGTQVAMESADIVLVEDRLEKVPEAIGLSRRILRIVKENVAIAVGTVLLLLAGVVTRHVGLGLGMLVHEASILIVIANGMRLLRPARRDVRQATGRGVGLEAVSGAASATGSGAPSGMAPEPTSGTGSEARAVDAV